MISNNHQSTYYQGSSSPLFSSSSDSNGSTYLHQPQPQQQQQQFYFTQNPYYHSPTESPLSSPHILNHHYFYSSNQQQQQMMEQEHIHQSPSPPTSFSSLNNTTRVIRYDITLEAPTAASQKIDESPLTYLNKGQYYNISLRDNERFDGDIISVISINFHDESHRLGATDYWKFWLTQQKDADTARAVEIEDLRRSNGAQAVECKQFDRISFRWNGKLGASVNIRFNCLSTDFSRIKGVKGIPLRLQIESEQLNSMQQPMLQQHQPERTYCRIKLFRDKGAERKNKDDAKHIERQLEKLRGRNGELHPLWLAFSPTAPVTSFKEIIPPEEEETNHHHHVAMEDPRLLSHHQHEMMHTLSNSSNASNILLPPPNMKRSFSGYQQGSPELSYANTPLNTLSMVPTPLGIDPSYVPQRRRRIAKLSLLVKFGSCELYRAIYLEHLTVQELKEKIIQRMDIQRPISNVLRKVTSKKNKPPMIVEVNDEVIGDMTEEQDIFIQTEELADDSINLILNF